jgi:ABC-2 type transport system ATP-binding protein
MTYALEISDLNKTYGNDFTALKGISLNVAKGDFYALLGPNGAGKSTTIGITSSLVNKSSGSVRVFGFDLDTQRRDVKRHIGLVPQEFNFNVFEPVEEIVINQGGYYGIPRGEAAKRAEALLKQLGLWEKRREIARNLSGGMKRRLMIARALVHRPQLLILDEPTAGVDIEIRQTMWKFLREINEQGTTIILTTHYLEEAEQLCRNIGIIDQGQLVENTSMKALLNQLNMETFVLDLSNEITDTPNIDGYVLRLLDSNTLEVDVEKEQCINELFSKLTAQDIRVRSMRNKVNRLEELFMSLVEKDKA